MKSNKIEQAKEAKEKEKKVQEATNVPTFNSVLLDDMRSGLKEMREARDAAAKAALTSKSNSSSTSFKK